MNCRYVARDLPRVLPGRHGDECPEVTWHPPMVWPDCIGCVPCPARHCRACGSSHVEQETCPGCVGSARDHLRDIVDLSTAARLVTEAAHKGTQSEAANLAGPVANPEAWGHVSASIVVGRLPRDWQERADHELHPLTVLGTWEDVIRDAYDDPTTLRVTIPRAAAYISRRLHEVARDPYLPFEDLANDLRRCKTHLEVVLHDQGCGDFANVPCFACGGDLERKLVKDGFDDCWTCRRCGQRYTYGQYNFALRARLEAEQSERIEA